MSREKGKKTAAPGKKPPAPVRLHCFPPAGALGAKEAPVFLVLGSFHSVLSLQKKQYYGNPNNHFWTVLQLCFQFPEPQDYDEKMHMLKQSRIAIWEVYASCFRKGSLDSNIREAEPTPLVDFLEGQPTIERIGLNGGASASGFYAQFKKQMISETGFPAKVGTKGLWKPDFGPDRPERKIAVFRLPSTSPIPTSAFRSAADKIPFWQAFFTIQM